MNPHRSEPTTVRWKAVWGPKRTSAVLLLVLLGLVPGIAGAGPNTYRRSSVSAHSRKAKTANSGQPSRRVKNYRVDEALTRRYLNRQRGETADVIACLTDGKDLPARYKRFARYGKFSIVNCYALDRLPIDDLQALSKLSELHRVHENRRSSVRTCSRRQPSRPMCSPDSTATPVQASRSRSSIRASRNTPIPTSRTRESLGSSIS